MSALMRSAVLVLLAGTIVACQPADEPDLTPPDAAEATAAGTTAPGAPPVGVPTTLAGLRERAEPVAADWQPGARLVEVVVELSEAAPGRAVMTYVAADADRLLVLTVDDDAVAEQQPTLAGLDLEELPAGAVEAIPGLPEDALDPAALAEAAAPALDACGHGATPQRVRYTTPAPEAWDGGSWTTEMVWAAAAVGEGGGVIVNPSDGEPAGDSDCFAL